MINTSAAYKEAISAVTRRTKVRLPMVIVSPDLEYGTVTVTSQAVVSKPEQVYDEITDGAVNYAVLETNRWTLDGTVPLVADDYDVQGEVGVVGGDLPGIDGTFETPQVVTLSFSGVSTLQAVSLYFSDREADGVPEDFTVSLLSGSSVLWSESVTGNHEQEVNFKGFTIYTPTAMRISVTKWSLPYRRIRILELFPGFKLMWTDKNITKLSVQMKADISGLTLPYGAASVTFDNRDKTFDPRNKEGFFRSLEERQEVPVFIGVVLADGSTDYIPCGVFFQHDIAWNTGDSGMTITWSLVDIIGLLTSRNFVPPQTLPTTLSGWAAALVAQLGENFEDYYTVDPSLASLSVTATAADINGKSCSDILRWLCQISGTFARADAETGYLALEPLWSQGNEYDLNNLKEVPTISANDNVGSIVFKINGSDYVVSGNTVTSANNVSVNNPFLHSTNAALDVAKHILTAYGGNRFSAVSRGDMSSEIGDVVTLQLDKSNAVTGRLLSQTLEYTEGVLQNCKLELLQSDGGELYTDRVAFLEDGSWTVPSDVTAATVVLVGGGQGGGYGKDPDGASRWPTSDSDFSTTWDNAGARGDPGSGGKIWYNTINVVPGQVFAITIGQGGAAAESVDVDGHEGGATTFGAYSSANGRVYTPSYTDVFSGNAYGRTGVAQPVANTGDGGQGGAGGTPGYTDWEKVPGGWIAIEHEDGKPGKPGVAGASGCVIIYWNKDGE